MVEEIRNGGKLHRPQNWQDFERLTRDYYAKIFDSRDVTLNGRQGQNQRGVDVHGRDRFHDNRLVGIQCKGLNDPEFGRNKLISPAGFRAEVEKAKKFDPDLQQFILLSTAPLDDQLDELARKLTEEHKAVGLFEVTYHGWEWLEQELRPFPEILRRYGLATVLDAPVRSEVAVQIGERFAEYLELANRAAGGGNSISLQSIARHLGEADWRRLEMIRVGTSLANDAELSELAEALGISPDWLIDGVGTPFFIQKGLQLEQARPMFARITACKPRRVHLIRQKSEPFDAAICVEVNDFLYRTFDNSYPLRSLMAGGVHYSFDLWCLIKKLRATYGEYGGKIRSYHLENEAFNDLFSGKTFPGSVIAAAQSDTWWLDFGDLASNLMPRLPLYWSELASATFSVSGELNRVKKSADPLNLELLSWMDTPGP